MGLGVLARMVSEEMRLVNTAPEESSLPGLANYICERVDEIAVVVEWEPTRIKYLDQCGRLRNLDLSALWRTFAFQLDEDQQASPIYCSIDSLWSDETLDNLTIRSDGMDKCILTITFPETEGIPERFRIQHTVQLRVP